MPQSRLLASILDLRPETLQCNQLLQIYADMYVEKKFHYAKLNQNISYFVPKMGNLDKQPPAHTVLPQLDHNKRLMVIVDNDGHVSLIYRNHRIDSNGLVGIKVTSYLKKSAFARGALGFIFYDLPNRTLDQLDKLIENFEVKSERTCTLVTCTYLEDVFPNEMNLSLTTSNLVSGLIKSHVEGRNIAIVSLNDQSPIEALRSIKRRELLSPVYFVGQIFSKALLFVTDSR